MSLNQPEVLDKIINNLSQSGARDAGMGNEILRSKLKAQIIKGMDEAFEQVKTKGKHLAFNILGIDTKWHDWQFTSGSMLREELLGFLRPQAKDLAQELIDGADIAKFSTLTKIKRAQLMRSLRDEYDSQVNKHVREHFKKFIEEKAAKDVAELWEHMPIILGEGKTLEDVIANHFTDMLSQDDDLKAEQHRERMTAVRDFMVSTY